MTVDGGRPREAATGDSEQRRYLVSGSHLKSAWVTGLLFVAIVAIEGLAVAPTLLAAGVPLGVVLHTVLYAHLDETNRGVATLGAVGAFVAAVVLGFLAEAVWVALGVDVGALVLGYAERWWRDR